MSAANRTGDMSPDADCCPGEPAWGDPRGLHNEDCPVYLRWAEASVARTRELMWRQSRLPQLPTTVDAWLTGYAVRWGCASGTTPTD